MNRLPLIASVESHGSFFDEELKKAIDNQFQPVFGIKIGVQDL
jgi:hypothetical protein